jgi:hypothetical protein
MQPIYYFKYTEKRNSLQQNLHSVMHHNQVQWIGNLAFCVMHHMAWQIDQIGTLWSVTHICFPSVHYPYTQLRYDPIYVRGHPSVSLPLLYSPTLPLSICMSPTPLYHLQGPHPQSQRLLYSKSDDFPDVDSPKVVNIPSPLPLAPQHHRTSLGRIGMRPCDTMALSCGMTINGSLGTGSLGAVISVYYV